MATLVAICVNSAVTFPRLQRDADEALAHSATRLENRARRFVGFHLARRPETSLTELVSLAGPFNRIENYAYSVRRGLYQVQSWMRGHEAEGPPEADLGAPELRRIALLPVRTDPDAARLHPLSGLVLMPMVVRSVRVPGHSYEFLFDPRAPAALSPGEHVLLLPDPERPRRIFVTSESRLHEIEDRIR